MNLPPCYVCKRPASWLVKIRGTSKANPRQRRPVCDAHSIQALEAKYSIQPLVPQQQKAEA